MYNIKENQGAKTFAGAPENIGPPRDGGAGRIFMGWEIERKFLVKEELWRPQSRGVEVRQGYLPQAGDLLVRVRLQDERAFLTLKGKTNHITRAEFEYEIPAADARALLPFCQRPFIEKVRYREKIGDHIWEIDRFLGDNEGLLLAEIELRCEDESFLCPPWLGAEVSEDPRYYNSNLVKTPYTTWDKG